MNPSKESRKTMLCMRYVRNDHGKQSRKLCESGLMRFDWGLMRDLYPRTDGLCNTIDTVQKDNLVLEVGKIGNADKQRQDYP